MLDGVYRLPDGVPIFQAIPSPTPDQLQALLTRIITRLLKMLTRQGALREEVSEIPYLTDPDADPAWPRCMRRPAPTALRLAPEPAKKC